MDPANLRTIKGRRTHGQIRQTPCRRRRHVAGAGDPDGGLRADRGGAGHRQRRQTAQAGEIIKQPGKSPASIRKGTGTAALVLQQSLFVCRQPPRSTGSLTGPISLSSRTSDRTGEGSHGPTGCPIVHGISHSLRTGSK